MRELKPCPFCKSLEWFSDMPPHKDFTGYVRCNFCGAETPFDTWNTRPIEDALNKRIIEVTKLYLQTKDAFNLATEILLKQDARVAELEAFVGKLIEVGDEMSDQSYWHEIKWQALVKDWKER